MSSVIPFLLRILGFGEGFFVCFLRTTREDIDTMNNVRHFAWVWANPSFQSQSLLKA